MIDALRSYLHNQSRIDLSLFPGLCLCVSSTLPPSLLFKCCRVRCGPNLSLCVVLCCVSWSSLVIFWSLIFVCLYSLVISCCHACVSIFPILLLRNVISIPILSRLLRSSMREFFEVNSRRSKESKPESGSNSASRLSVFVNFVVSRSRSQTRRSNTSSALSLTSRLVVRHSFIVSQSHSPIVRCVLLKRSYHKHTHTHSLTQKLAKQK